MQDREALFHRHENKTSYETCVPAFFLLPELLVLAIKRCNDALAKERSHTHTQPSDKRKVLNNLKDFFASPNCDATQ